MEKDLIYKARNANLPEYLISRGEPLVQKGSRYRHKEHDSLVFTNNMYYWNSKSEYGNAIDFLVNYYQMGFESAVNELLGASPIDTIKAHDPTNKFSFGDIETNENMSRAIAYLNKTRGINSKIIQSVLDKKLLYQEAKTNNIVFAMTDENSSVVGAEISGTLSDIRFKGVSKGSKYGYGFNIKFGESPKYLLPFECAIDLLSFIDIEKGKGKTLDNCLLVSMAGLKKNVIDKMMMVYGKMQIVMCVDNDSAGKNFIQEVNKSYNDIKVLKPIIPFKDWNDQLNKNDKKKNIDDWKNEVDVIRDNQERKESDTDSLVDKNKMTMSTERT